MASDPLQDGLQIGGDHGVPVEAVNGFHVGGHQDERFGHV